MAYMRRPHPQPTVLLESINIDDIYICCVCHNLDKFYISARIDTKNLSNAISGISIKSPDAGKIFKKYGITDNAQANYSIDSKTIITCYRELMRVLNRPISEFQEYIIQERLALTSSTQQRIMNILSTDKTISIRLKPYKLSFIDRIRFYFITSKYKKIIYTVSCGIGYDDFIYKNCKEYKMPGLLTVLDKSKISYYILKSMGNDIAMEVFEKSNFKNNNYVFIDKQEANKFKDDIVVPNDIIRQLRSIV